MGISEDIMAAAKAGQQAEEIKALREEIQKMREVLFYCGSTLSAKTPDSLGDKVVIKEWQKRAQHCWERINALEAAK